MYSRACRTKPGTITCLHLIGTGASQSSMSSNRTRAGPCREERERNARRSSANVRKSAQAREKTRTHKTKRDDECSCLTPRNLTTTQPTYPHSVGTMNCEMLMSTPSIKEILRIGGSKRPERKQLMPVIASWRVDLMEEAGEGGWRGHTTWREL